MNDSDVLRRTAAVLRSAHDGQREGSGFTRARILSTLAERRSPRRVRWLVLAPLGTLLLVGSAWAQSTDSWPRVWQAVASVLRIETSVSAPRGALAPQAAPRLPQAPPATAPPEEPALPDPVPPPPAATPAPAPHAKASKSARSAAPTAAPPSRPEPPAPDPELSQFRAAHERQLQARDPGQRRAAIAAYAEYLRAYPHGRFVPEARYNTALDWIKLGEVAAARAALAPFADGGYDGYRQQEARELLEALGPSQ